VSTLSLLFSLIALCGIAYLCIALFAVRRFMVIPSPLREAPHDSGADRDLPPITILKPVHGLDVELFENLCSFCEQAYPAFQVVFGVQRRDDPAIQVVRAVMDRYATSRDVAFVVDDRPLEGNPKMANVAKMMKEAKHDLLTISDADMRVGPEYLRAVAAAFGDPSVGAATCLYVGSARGNIVSQLAAMHINDQFLPSVLVALLMQPLAFCFGSTMAVRRSALSEIGGIDGLRAHLADDYMLGALVHAKGYRVALCPYVVRNVMHESSLGSLWHREVRWARVIRSQRPLGYAFSFITFPLPFALLVLLLPSSTALGAILAAITVALRATLANTVRSRCHPERRRGSDPSASPRRSSVEGQPPTSGSTWLIPARDIIGLAVWAASFFGRSVRWRHQKLQS
jgi:ceramide glucosyltransferase